jgi:hypothetical protein
MSLVDPSIVVSVADATEAAARQVMAKRAAIKLRYDTRVVREDLLAEANDLLEKYNLLTLGR